MFVGIGKYGGQAADERENRLGLPCPVVDDARPERNAIGVESGRDVDRAAQKIDPPGPAGRIGRDQCRFVLLVRVEQKAGAGFDDAAQPVFRNAAATSMSCASSRSSKGLSAP